MKKILSFLLLFSIAIGYSQNYVAVTDKCPLISFSETNLQNISANKADIKLTQTSSQVIVNIIGGGNQAIYWSVAQARAYGYSLDSLYNHILDILKVQCDTSGGGGGSGTVTSIATDATMTGSPITTTGTLKVDTTIISTKQNVIGLTQGKQDALVSGTNIKTINSTSLLGSGNITTPDAQTLTAGTNTLTISGGNTVNLNRKVDTVCIFKNTDRDSICITTTINGISYRSCVKDTTGGGSSSSIISALTAATSTNTIDNTNYKQEWQWNTHVSGSAFKLSTNLTSAHTPVAGSAVLEVSLANSYQPSFSGTNYAGKFINSYYSHGGSNTSIAGYFETNDIVSGGVNSAVYAKGNIRIEAGKLFFGQYARISGQSGGISFQSGTSLTNDAGSYTYGMEAGNTVRVIRNYNSQPYYNWQTSYIYKDISTSRQVIAFGVDNDLATTASVGTSYGWIERSADKLMFAAQAGLSSGTAITPNYLLTLYGTNSNVGIGTTTPSASSKLEITSTNSFFTPPRMTSTQRDAVASPKAGDSLFCTDCTATDTTTGVMQTYNGSTWKNNW